MTSRSASAKVLIMLGTPIHDRQAERREATRAEIIAAAWAIAEEKGLAATKVVAGALLHCLIAGQAEVRPGHGLIRLRT